MTATTSRAPLMRVGPTTAMYVGLALTVLATLAPLLDIATIDTLSDHVRDAYPQWGPRSVSADRTAIAGYLVATGVLGAALWLLTIRAVAAGKRWARAAATAAFAIGTLVALTNLSMGGERYDVIVPYPYGVLTLLPCLAGLVTVVSLRRHEHPAPRA